MAIPPELAGLGALALLLLLPGLIVVRAPWTAVPFLSLAFWVTSWWWLPSRLSRERFLLATLAASALLACLRLLKPLGACRPSWPAALVACAAAARLTPLAFWPVAPGPGASLEALSALLLVWRDGVPTSYEPLLPLPVFGAHPPGLAALAADISLVSGLPAHRSALLVALAAGGLLALALFSLLLRVCAGPVAAVSAILTVSLAGWEEAPSLLALAFAVAAAALLGSGTGRASSVAAGTFLAAAFEVHAAAALTGLVAGLAVALLSPRRPLRCAADRAGVAVVVALLLVAPYLPRSRWAGAGHGVAPALAPGARIGVTADDVEAMVWIRDHSGPLDLVCSEGAAGAWIRAVAGRAVRDPDAPASAERRGSQGRPCALTYVRGRAPAGRLVFRNASASVLEGAPP